MIIPKIVCLGANQESQYVLQRLLDNEVPISGLVTLPVCSEHRGSDYCDLHPLAAAHNLLVIDTDDINNNETKRSLQELAPDYMFVLGWSQLLSKDTLGVVSSCVVGSHPSILPAGRGRAPIPWTILGRERKSAVTLFKMTPGIDDGMILVQEYFDVPERAYANDVYGLVQKSLFTGFFKLYKQIVSNDVREVSQEHSMRSYRGRRILEDGFLDFNNNVSSIDCLVRAVSDPYPGAYFYFNDERIAVWEVEVDQDVARVGVPGQILSKSGDWLVVRCSDGCVKLRNFTFGSSVVSIKAFKIGEVLNYRVSDEINALRKTVQYLERQVTLLIKGSHDE